MLEAIPFQPTVDLSSLRKFVRSSILPGVREREEKGEFPIEIFKALHQQGWLQSAIPKQLGGMGLHATDLAFIAREIAYASPGITTSFIGNILGMSPVILYAKNELKEKLCRDYQNQFSLWSFCMTEPDTGTDIFNTKTKAQRVKGGYLLNGKKCFITNAGVSSHLVVFARVEDEKGQGPKDAKSPLTAFYVPTEIPGVSRGKPLEKLGQRESNTAELYFDSVFVPEEFRIGEEGAGIRVAFHSLHRTKMMFAASAVGTCDRALELVSDHLAGRKLYGNTLLSLPTIRTLLAQLATEVDAAWLLAIRAAATWDTGDFAVKEASMAKMFAGHTAVKVTCEVLELFGGYGYSVEYEAERLYRDAKLFEIIEGASFVQQILISKELFRGYKEQSEPQKESHKEQKVKKKKEALKDRHALNGKKAA